MTIGIYMLSFQERIYIGQSNNCSRRYAEHVEALTSGTHKNRRVRAAYELHGLPKLTILAGCALEDLNRLEIMFIQKYNSYGGYGGLNLTGGGGYPRKRSVPIVDNLPTPPIRPMTPLNKLIILLGVLGVCVAGYTVPGIVGVVCVGAYICLR